ncbi:glycosyltransferase family 2 protein [Coralloluteibacterium stylophorae]|uniref:Glycosyltransferase family 2 protein n=1 Tax=Coralloluteibacterium stylophorae TaxID=1776034 RepID=A0A8J8AXL1_9GAMM|nr:glycosyltransferase family 2 protein [Coralloluteibacterium stylophorae]MBS7458756.1 glycosyltransferase family 2 protein [Coralloluteibacterium stylophorae]
MNATTPRVAVLIPALNEELAIAAVLDSVLALGLPVIVVDDGSDDRTPRIVAERPVTLIRHASRQGKGEALRDGFREALAQGFDGVVTMDGDGQHVASDVPRLLAAAAAHPHHIVLGARLVNRHRQPGYRRAANDFADWGIGWACGQRLLDTQSGQRYYPRAVLELADLPSEGFVFESDILIEASWRAGVRVAAVPIESRYQGDFRKSHFRSLPDFLRIAGHVIAKIVRAGFLWSNFRRSRREPALLVEVPEDRSRLDPGAPARA